MSLSKEVYQGYVDRLASRELKIKLSRTPTTMGPGYIADKIAEILDAKSIVNEMAEKVELALCEAQVRLNDLEEEIQLRTHLEYENFDPSQLNANNAKSREAYIWSQVEKGYIADWNNNLSPGEPHAGPFQLSENLRIWRGEIIELKSLLKIIEYRRDELGKLDSGVRLQQKTMETEASIYGKAGKPVSSVNGGAGSTRVNGKEPDEMDDPDSGDEEFVEAPPPLV